jgi:hypothetical protein
MEAHQKAKRSFSKMRTSVLYIASVFLLMVSLSPLQAQEYHRFNFGAGAGVSVPTSDASANLNTGWNINVRGGVNVTQSFLADLDFTYNRWDLNAAALARAGQPGGYADVWSVSFEPMIRLAPRSPVDPYILGGAGIYHRGLTLTQPTTFTQIFCDPFFGYCCENRRGVSNLFSQYASSLCSASGRSKDVFTPRRNRSRTFSRAQDNPEVVSGWAAMSGRAGFLSPNKLRSRTLHSEHD